VTAPDRSFDGKGTNASRRESLRVGTAIGLFLLVLPCIFVPLIAGVLIALTLGENRISPACAIAGLFTSPPLIALAMKTVGNSAIALDSHPINQALMIWKRRSGPRRQAVDPRAAARWDLPRPTGTSRLFPPGAVKRRPSTSPRSEARKKRP
jgi:hypothetical protein